jgi:hypothetical protein
MTRTCRLLSCLAAGLALAAGSLTAESPAAGGAGAQPPSPLAPASVAGAPSPRAPFEGVFTIGATGTDRSGSLNRVGEYDVLHQGTLPRLGLQFWGERGTSRFDVQAFHAGDARDQRYALSATVARRLRASVSYNRMPHRLDHDPLSWMDAASPIGGTFVVRHTDTAPGAAYGLTQGELVARADYAVPFTQGNVRFFLGHRRQARDGHHQALTTSHCATCHTYSHTREMNQRLRDVTAGALLQFNALTVDYGFENRRFDERGDQPLIVYDRARQPATLADVFLNRVQYDDRNGALPFATVPGLGKDSHALRARLALPRDATLTGAFTHATSTNRDMGLDTVLTSTSGRFVMPFGRRLTVRAAVRHYTIESDDVPVDVVELIAPAGPAAGRTYAQAYPSLGQVDFVRRSSLNRSPTLAEIEGVWRPFRRTTVRLGYEWEEVRRDNFEVERTTTNTLRASARSTLGKTFHTQTRFAYDWIDQPFAHVHAAVPAVLQPYMSPNNQPFGSALQYFQFYRTRSVNLSAMPGRDGFFEETATWTPSPRASISAQYRFRTSSNDQLSVSSWDQSTHMPGVQAWFAPADRIAVAGGYTYQRERTETLFSTLAFIG